MWINIAIECSEFRIEHKEDVYKRQVRETLLKEFANCSDKLFNLGIIRTDSFTGEIGEFIASKYFKLSLSLIHI